MSETEYNISTNEEILVSLTKVFDSGMLKEMVKYLREYKEKVNERYPEENIDAFKVIIKWDVIDFDEDISFQEAMNFMEISILPAKKNTSEPSDEKVD